MSLSHHPINASIPSLNVSGDINFAYPALAMIKKDLISYEASPENGIQLIGKIQKALKNVTSVYNENVHQINYGKSLVKEHNFPTFDEWSISQPFYFKSKTMDVKRAEYNEDLDKSQRLYWAKLEVNYNLAELAGPQLLLRTKIEKMIQRAEKQGIPVGELPAFEKLNFTEIELLHYHQQLREPSSKTIPFDAIPVDGAVPIDTSTQFRVLYLEKQLRRQILSPEEAASSSSSSTTSTSSKEPASPSIDMSQPDRAPQTHSVKIRCPLADNQVLGICQDPEWGNKPIPFTSSDHQIWQVELPRNHEFKYVIIEPGKDLRWELKGGNRCLRPDSSLPSSFDEAPKF